MSLRTALVRLAKENVALRPHLLPILRQGMNSPALVSRLRETFGEGFLDEVEGQPSFQTLRRSKGVFDASWSVDRWSYYSDSHDPEEGGGDLDYSYPSKVQARFTVVLDDIPAGADTEGVRRIVTNLLEANGKTAFQQDILNEGDLYTFLEESLAVSGGEISGMGWEVKRADVRSVDVDVNPRSERVVVHAVVDLDVEDDPQGATGEAGGRWGRHATDIALRNALIRTAAVFPDLRGDLLPLIKSAMERGAGGLIFSLTSDSFSARTQPTGPGNQVYDVLLLIKKAKRPFDAAMQVIRAHKDEIYRMKGLYEVESFVNEKVKALVGKTPDWHDYSMPD